MPKFVPRQRKHKVIARNKPTSNNNGQVDTKAAEILPREEQERAEQRHALKHSLLHEAQGKISSKKKKRLDKYIDTKLKKEENLALLKKLAARKVDTSLLESSKKLGSGGKTKRETLRQAFAESRAGINVEKNELLLLKEIVPREVLVGSNSEDEPSEVQQSWQQPKFRMATTGEFSGHSIPLPPSSSKVDTCSSVAPPMSKTLIQGLAEFGAGLKRPLETDANGRPVLPTRKRRKANSIKITIAEDDDGDEWKGFGSDGNGQGSDNEETTSSVNSDADINISSEDEESEQQSESDSSEQENSNSSDGDYASKENKRRAKLERTSVFKAWATQQRNDAVGFVPSNNLSSMIPTPLHNFQPRPFEQEPLPPELSTSANSMLNRKVHSVTIERSSEIMESRLKLPVVPEEQKIMEAVHNNNVVVICGATGSGKTTQVPQFLYEAGYGATNGPTPGMIGVTQPRRLAAVSMSRRVADELGDHRSRVAYQIRFDTSTSVKTSVKFMTDGILLREISRDFALTKYSAIVIDEAHERSVNTDILIGMLSRIVDLRTQLAMDDARQKPLKLIIMSATLRISDFTENKRLFRNESPPLIKLEGRQYAVTTHFARRTQRDYVEEMLRKVCRGHRQLPKGAILVFLTGQNEIAYLAKRLKQSFPSTQGQEVKAGKILVSPAETPLETEDIELGSIEQTSEDNDGSESEDSFLLGLDNEDDKEFEIENEKPEETVMKVHVLPLYSQLPTNLQLRIFEPPPKGSRLIVLATNVAETSLTIPDIRYVFDCGRAKEKKYDIVTGVQSFEVGWISKASANQRSGRAGRTGPGHCYRLYSSAVFERDFEEYATPEISRTPLEGVVLQLKSMGAPVANFPFPTPPDRESLIKAERLLSYLGALSSDGKVTKFGNELSLYPLNPRFARMVVTGVTQGLPAETVALVAALSVSELIIPESKLGLNKPLKDTSSDNRTEQDNFEASEISHLRKAYNAAMAKLNANAKQSDCIKFSNAVCAYAYESNPQSFCEDMFLNAKAVEEASQLREQLTNIIRAHRLTAIGVYTPRLAAPSERSINLLTQICAAGFIDQIAMRADLAPVPPMHARKPKIAIDVPYLTLFSSQTEVSDDPNTTCVFLHPSSILARTPPAKMPAYIIYSHLQRANASFISGCKTPKTRMYPLTPITRPQIINIALNTPLLQASKPKGKIVDLPHVNGAERRECEVELSLMGEKGKQGWGLGVRRVQQRKDETGKFVIEKIVG